MQCNLCTADYAAYRSLGKARQRQVIKLKIQWTEELDAARRERLVDEMVSLLHGTQDLGRIVFTYQFVLVTAGTLRQSDASFTAEEATDFILRCFVEGHVQGKGQPLNACEREEYFKRLETEAFHCAHTGRRLQFFRSFMPDMASPDRLNFAQGKSLHYSDPFQVTVRSSWWANMFFGDHADRDDYLQRLCSAYMDDNRNLAFEETFSVTDEIIRQFLCTPLQERVHLNRKDICLVPPAKAQKIFDNIKYGWKRGQKKPSVSEFQDCQEVKNLFKAFGSRCVVSGLNGRDFTLSLDRKIDTTGRYNWTDVNPMLWSINHAKASFRFAFETESDFNLWYAEHHEEYDELVRKTLDACTCASTAKEKRKEVQKTWVVVVEMRKFFVSLLRRYHSRL